MKRVFRIAATRIIELQDGMPRCGKGSTPLFQHGSVCYCDSDISPYDALITTINAVETGDWVCS
jgi:hypothetical protein